jgi:uncharacterized Fe-S cluster protein YjdI
MTAKGYTGAGIEVTYDRDRCVHFAECVRGLPEVFEVGRRPWIMPDAAGPEEIAEVVRRCPSGALRYHLASGPEEEPVRPTQVEPLPGGPTLLRGDLRIPGPDGVETSEVRAALCACGQTRLAPYCDGSCPSPPTKRRR